MVILRKRSVALASTRPRNSALYRSTAAANTACAGADFPQVNSNIFSAKTDQTLYAPSVLITRDIDATAPDGSELRVPLKVGFIGFTPPQILSWDKASLDGKLTTKGVQEVAAPLIEDLRSRGADLVIAIVHGGGPQATDLQKRLGLPTTQVAGRRVTDAATLDVMKMVVAGKLNVDLCARLVAAVAGGRHGTAVGWNGRPYN